MSVYVQEHKIHNTREIDRQTDRKRVTGRELIIEIVNGFEFDVDSFPNG